MFSISVGHCWQIQCTAAGRNSRIFGKVRASKYVSWHLQRGPLWKMDPKATTRAKVTWVLPVQPARLVLVQIPCICFNFKMNLSKIEKCICLNWRRQNLSQFTNGSCAQQLHGQRWPGFYLYNWLDMYLSKFQNVFVWIQKYIFLNLKGFFLIGKSLYQNWKKDPTVTTRARVTCTAG